MTIYYDLPPEEYFTTEALSASGIKLLLQSPAHYKNAPRVETKSMSMGTAIHAAILEPERFKNDYVVYEGDGRTKAVKELIAAAEANNQIPIKQTDYNTIQEIIQSIQRHDKATQLLDQTGCNEVSILTQKDNNINLKGRIDKLTTDTIIDLKTTTDASPNGFLKAVYKYKYYLQAYFYKMLMEIETGKKYNFIFIAVETTQPYGVGVYELSLSFDGMAAIECNKAIKTYQDCLKTGEWNDYADEVVTLTPYEKK